MLLSFPFELKIYHRRTVAGYHTISVNVLPERQIATTVSTIRHFELFIVSDSLSLYAQNRDILCLYFSSRGVLRPPRLRHLTHGWRRWQARMGMDLHSGTSPRQTSDHTINSPHQSLNRKAYSLSSLAFFPSSFSLALLRTSRSLQKPKRRI